MLMYFRVISHFKVILLLLVLLYIFLEPWNQCKSGLETDLRHMKDFACNRTMSLLYRLHTLSKLSCAITKANVWKTLPVTQVNWNLLARFLLILLNSVSHIRSRCTWNPDPCVKLIRMNSSSKMLHQQKKGKVLLASCIQFFNMFWWRFSRLLVQKEYLPWSEETSDK